jgi:hypothetical protein
MAQFTIEQIKSEIEGLAEDSAAFFYLSLELSRREGAGRPKTSDLTRAEQNAANVKRYRERKAQENK